jgi:hypothetical protein
MPRSDVHWRTTSAEALLVSSVAFLDEPVRWNLVLCLEKLPPDLSTFIKATPARAFCLEA